MVATVPVSWRLLIAAGCIAAFQASIWQLDRRTRRDAADAAKFEVADLPLHFEGWTGSETKLDERLIKHIGALTEPVNRRYEDRAGNQVAVHLASFPTAEVSLPHSPRLCYTNAGWKIAKGRWRTVEGDWRISVFVVQSEEGRALVAYWYQLGEFVASDRAELRAALQTLRREGRRWPPLVKVLMQIPIATTEEQAVLDIESLASEIHGWVIKKS